MMKTRNFMVIAGLLFASIGTANGQTPIKDTDAFEKKYIECITSGFKNKCFSVLLRGHFAPDAEGQTPRIPQATAASHKVDEFANQLGGVYQVHPLDKTIRANVWDSRTYLIEHLDGRFSASHINFVKMKGEWYVFSYGFNQADGFVKQLLKLPAD
jgi:hypothetical protein